MPVPRFSELQHSPRARGLLFALAALACCALLALAFPGGLTRLELAASDLRYRLAPRPRPSASLVLVDIDDATVRRFGKWPLSRAVHARVLDVLTDCGVAAVGYDIVFHGPAQGERGAAEDAGLEAAIARSGRVVFPVGVGLVREADTVRLTPEADDLPLLPALLPPGDLHVPDLLQVEKSFLPLARFSSHALSLGHIAATPDADGAYRRMPLLVGFHGQLLPCLGLALARQALGASISVRPGAVVLSWPGGTGNSGGGTLAVPMDAQGLAPVNLAAPYGSGFWHLSYAEVLDAAADPARLAFLRQSLAGKVVLVGLTATGTTDIKATPLSPAEPLVTLHANLTSQLLTRSVLRPAPAWAAPAVFALFLAACALCFLRLPMRWFPAAGLGLAALYPAANIALYAATGISLSLAPASLGLFVFALALLAHGLMRAATDSARQRRMLEVYFSPAIARQILESGADIMQGRSVDVSVLFSDIAGFTAMSDHMEPAEVQRFLGEYLEEMTACVYNNGGAVDKFMGDGLMAFFGYPEAEGADSVENARRSALSGVRAAVEMQAALQRLNARWQAQGRQKIAIRIGVNTGHCIVGDMGSASRRDFTLLGRNVNLAQRLEANCPQGGVLLSARTAALVAGQFDLGEPYSLKVKGFDAEVEVRTVRLPEPLRGMAPEA
jgi:adenylate cyclase